MSYQMVNTVKNMNNISPILMGLFGADHNGVVVVCNYCMYPDHHSAEEIRACLVQYIELLGHIICIDRIRGFAGSRNDSLQYVLDDLDDVLAKLIKAKLMVDLDSDTTKK
jgi:hypothetical protein